MSVKSGLQVMWMSWDILLLDFKLHFYGIPA